MFCGDFDYIIGIVGRLEFYLKRLGIIWIEIFRCCKVVWSRNSLWVWTIPKSLKSHMRHMVCSSSSSSYRDVWYSLIWCGQMMWPNCYEFTSVNIGKVLFLRSILVFHFSVHLFKIHCFELPKVNFSSPIYFENTPKIWNKWFCM